MAGTQLSIRASEPERILKCRRLDELLHRISTVNNNAYEPCHQLLGKAYLAGEAPDYFASKLYAPEGAKETLSMQAASPPASHHQDLPLDLSFRTESMRRESIASASSSEASEASGWRAATRPPPPSSPPRAPQHPPPRALLPLLMNAVVEQVPYEPGLAHACHICGQMFSLHDRLAKHVASRHRAPRSPDGAARAYECGVCLRRFARSDMLTRHARLHTGVKPYSCSVCEQEFTRSDHLSTHQRTHTGEKPYRCPLCEYAACRRDMITRHMRTHTRPCSRSPPN